jgi:hypothetical protein
VLRLRVFLLLVVVCLAACGGGGGSAPALAVAGSTAAALASETIPLIFESGTTTPLVAVSVGGGPAQSTVFSTNTAGLRVPIAALAGATYTDTGQAISVPLRNANGTFTVSGTVGKADVNVGGVDMGKAVPFQIVRQITCSFQPCTVNAFSGSNSGVFGVRPWIAEDGVLYSLMSELPGNLSTGFIVSLYGNQPIVRVGLTPSNTSGFSNYSVPTATLADGSPTWNQSAEGGVLPWCYTVVDGTSTAGPACSSGITSGDTGGGPMTLYVSSASPPPFVTPQTLAPLPTGAQMTATLGNIVWTLPPAGTCGPYNEVNVWYGPSSALPVGYVETNGATPYFSNDVLYDLKGGNFGMRSVTVGPPSLC